MTAQRNMSGQLLKLKTNDVQLGNGQKVECEVEGVEGGAKVLLLKVGNELRAMGTNCTRLLPLDVDFQARTDVL